MRSGYCILFLLILSSFIFPQTLQVQAAFPNLSFSFPVDIQNAGDGSDRLFIVEQGGIIRVVDNNPSATQSQIFLDIRNRVLVNDRFGLLGLVFHPDFEQNGYFYVNYNAAGPNRTVISRFSVSAINPDSANPASELILLEVNQPHRFHNGGQLAFGTDGYLYIGLGDGGPWNGSPDPSGHGQNRATLLGSMLRIDVDNSENGLNYAIPPDNPFRGNSDGFREEIWAWGFRNPWRFSFDPVTGWLWAADNGENLYEEIDIVVAGGNYGWKEMEAMHCYPPGSVCNPAAFELPIFEYGGNGQRRSVIGGYVYRGSETPELGAKYIYGDWLRNSIWALSYDGVNPPVNTLLTASFSGLSTFGLSESGEIYFAKISTGQIFRFEPTVAIDRVSEVPGVFSLAQNFPNPFNPETQIQYTVLKPANIEVKIFNLLGQEMTTLADRRHSPGSYSVTWDSRDRFGKLAPSGIYLYRLSAGEFSETRRMVLIR